jgi:hypothetical protein
MAMGTVKGQGVACGSDTFLFRFFLPLLALKYDSKVIKYVTYGRSQAVNFCCPGKGS